MSKNVIVVFGGMSSENEISVITGTMVSNLVDEEKYGVYPVYLNTDGEMFADKRLRDVSFYSDPSFRKKAGRALIADGKLYRRKGNRLKELCKADVILNCCHGRGGEDGAVAAIADLNKLANASPDLLASSLFMDKAATKLAARALGVKCADSFKICKRDYDKRGKMAIKCVETRLKYPVIIKPSRQGSSIGIIVAHDKNELEGALETAFAYDDIVLAEKFFAEKREINCAAYRKGGDVIVSECEEPALKREILTFQDKYIEGGKERTAAFPARISKRDETLIKGYTKLLYKRLDLRGIVRADFLISGGEVYFNEMNTVPGSLAYYLFCEKLGDFKEVLTDVIEQGLVERAVKDGQKVALSCGVINKMPAAHGKRL